MEYVYLNGEIIPEKKACVSVFDRGLLYGDGVFETFRAVNYLPEFFSEHFRRLRKSSSKIKLPLPLTMPELGRIVYSVCQKNKCRDAVVRLVLTRGRTTGGLSITSNTVPTMIVSAQPVSGMIHVDYAKGARIWVSSSQQKSVGGYDASIKSLNYLANAMAISTAIEHNCHESVILNEKGHILELSTANFFCLFQGCILTPPLTAGILPGVTRSKVIQIIKRKRLNFMEKTVSIKRISQLGGAFMTSSVRGVVPIIKIGRIRVADGEVPGVVKELGRLYDEARNRDRRRFLNKIYGKCT